MSNRVTMTQLRRSYTKPAARLALEHPIRWGYSTMDEGLLGSEWTLHEAVRRLPLVKYRRSRSGRIYVYTEINEHGEEGGGTFYVGRIPDLIEQGLGPPGFDGKGNSR